MKGQRYIVPRICSS